MQVNHNKVHNGIELKFDLKPDENTIQFVKSNGFRWSSRQKIWYAKYSETLFKKMTEYFDDAKVSKTENNDNIEKPKQENKVQLDSEIIAIGKMKLSDFVKAKINEINLDNRKYIFDEKHFAYAHLPKGRKRPDYYTFYAIHEQIQLLLLKNSIVIPIQNLLENPIHKGHPFTTIKHLLDQFKILESAIDYQDYKEKLDERIEFVGKEKIKWSDFKNKNLKNGQTVFGKKNNEFEKLEIYRLHDSGYYELDNNSFNTISVVSTKNSYIKEVRTMKLADLYLENPNENEKAKNIIEYFNFNEDNEKDKRIRIAKAKAIAKIKLLNIISLQGIVENLSFNKQIMLYKAGKLHERFVLNIGKPEKLLLKYGIKNDEIKIKQEIIKKALIKHDLLIDNFINLHNLINNPLAIFQSKQFKTSKIILVEMIDLKKHPVIVVISTNNNNEINNIASIHGKFERQLKKWEAEKYIMYKQKNFDL